MLGVHAGSVCLVIYTGSVCLVTKTLNIKGGTLEYEPNSTLQLRSRFTAYERVFTCGYTAPIDAVTPAASTGPKALMAAADHVSSAGQSPEGRSRPQAGEGSLPSALRQANVYVVAVALLAPSSSDGINHTGLMQGARGVCLARVPDPPFWNPDHSNVVPHILHCLHGRLPEAPHLQLMVWNVFAVDLDPSQQCADIVGQFQGYAQALVDALSWQDLTLGGVIGGQQHNPVMVLLTQLAARLLHSDKNKEPAACLS